MEVTEGLISLLTDIATGLLVGICFVLVLGGWRKFKTGRFWTKAEEVEVSAEEERKLNVVFFWGMISGVILSSGCALLSFIFVGPYYGSAFLLVVSVYVIYTFKAYNTIWRSNL